MCHFRKIASGIIVNVKVIPRSSRSEVAGVINDELRVKVTAPPIEGRANREVIEALYRFIEKIQRRAGGEKVRRGDITIVKGETSRKKLVEIRGIESI